LLQIVDGRAWKLYAKTEIIFGGNSTVGPLVFICAAHDAYAIDPALVAKMLKQQGGSGDYSRCSRGQAHLLLRLMRVTALPASPLPTHSGPRMTFENRKKKPAPVK